jgi:hypothetical protein
MPRVGFEPTIPVFERAKTVNALDRAATVIGCDVAGTIQNKEGSWLIQYRTRRTATSFSQIVDGHFLNPLGSNV